MMRLWSTNPRFCFTPGTLGIFVVKLDYNVEDYLEHNLRYSRCNCMNPALNACEECRRIIQTFHFHTRTCCPMCDPRRPHVHSKHIVLRFLCVAFLRFFLSKIFKKIRRFGLEHLRQLISRTRAHSQLGGASA